MENREIKHTSLPWKPSFEGTICIGVQNGDFYGQMICNTILPDNDEEYEKDKVEIEANMYFISEACNMHYKLIDRVKKLESIINRIRSESLYSLQLPTRLDVERESIEHLRESTGLNYPNHSTFSDL